MSEDKELQKLNTIENTEIDADDDDIEDAEDTIGDSSDVNKFSAAYEKETVINFNNAEQNASCYTLNTHKRQMLLNLAEEYPDDQQKRRHGGSYIPQKMGQDSPSPQTDRRAACKCRGTRQSVGSSGSGKAGSEIERNR